MKRSPLTLCISGANGKMGAALQSLISSKANEFQLLAGLAREKDSSGSIQLVTDIQSLSQKPDVIIDFSNPDYALEIAQLSKQENIPFVSGTTGFSEQQLANLENISRHIPLLWAANMSLGINLAMALVKLSALVLGEEAQVEISEAHHIHKIDAPSGTALALAGEIASTRGVPLKELISYNDEKATENHAADKIGFNVTRQGEIIGQHEVAFNLANEQLIISHKATDRKLFAEGALRAAIWLVNQPSGWYNMEDMMDIKKQLKRIV